MKFPQVKPEYFPLVGGLDIVTPAISIGPGKVFDAQNYSLKFQAGIDASMGLSDTTDKMHLPMLTTG